VICSDVGYVLGEGEIILVDTRATLFLVSKVQSLSWSYRKSPTLD